MKENSIDVAKQFEAHLSHSQPRSAVLLLSKLLLYETKRKFVSCPELTEIKNSSRCVSVHFSCAVEQGVCFQLKAWSVCSESQVFVISTFVCEEVMTTSMKFLSPELKTAMLIWDQQNHYFEVNGFYIWTVTCWGKEKMLLHFNSPIHVLQHIC